MIGKTNARLTKAISVLCVFAMISVAFSTLVTNVAADDKNDKKTIGSLNPDIATDEYTNRPYELVGGIVQIIYWLGGKDPEKIKMRVVNTIGEEWKTARENEGIYILIVKQKWEVPWWLWITSPFYAAILSAL